MGALVAFLEPFITDPVGIIVRLGTATILGHLEDGLSFFRNMHGNLFCLLAHVAYDPHVGPSSVRY